MAITLPALIRTRLTTFAAKTTSFAKSLDFRKNLWYIEAENLQTGSDITMWERTLSQKIVNTLKDALDYDHPCDLLLADSIIAWHWILAFGYRDYYSGDFYIQIMDEWNKNIKRFYKLNSGSAWLSATEYWM